jgi:catechol 2,3-dioxygenase-like lactoylglutathione lyase family enzyme
MTPAFIELSVRNLGASLRWYEHALGFTAELVDDENRFAMMQGGLLALKQGSPGSVRLQFEVKDLDAERARLILLGIGQDSDVKTSPEGYRRVTYRDPDGNAVALFERK